MLINFFFFSSRRRHTRSKRDWSSDVCSSDLGYSQGGITAGSLAADPAFLADVNVTALMTVGAPISDFPVDSGVDVLSIEHEQDLVPDLDGNENPASDNWSTVTVD